jgi:hypothetical protein
VSNRRSWATIPGSPPVRYRLGQAQAAKGDVAVPAREVPYQFRDRPLRTRRDRRVEVRGGGGAQQRDVSGEGVEQSVGLHGATQPHSGLSHEARRHR